jgi:hypothetical protein
MNTGVAIALVGATLVLVFMVNKQRAATTAAQIAIIKGQVYDPSKGLSLTDVVNAGVIAASTYFGGPAAGISAARQVH